MLYKAAIFDLDGTLLDTLDDLADAMNDALKTQGFATHPAERYKRMVGNGVINLAKRALPADRQEMLEPILGLMRQNYAKNALNKTKPYDGVLKTVLKLHENGVKLAVLTNKDQTFSVRIVEHYFGKEMFDLIWGAIPGRPIKPDPAALYELLTKLDVPPEKAVFVGDSGVDMDTAKAANVKSVGVTWGFRGRQELTEHHAGHIVDNPAELLKVLHT
ncbi:MAG: HAD family hydrolase [Sedimentisphaerales bacterium]|nr:HAD family hydrolase [Sedimentisphaerales bacterium]